MEYRPLGRTGLSVSAVSLGTEYLINLPREHVVQVIHEAIERGVNYFDLFFAQPAFRDNMGAAFRGWRDRAHLTAHLGATETNGQSDRTRDPRLAEEFFEDYLRRYETSYVDVLFLHNVDEPADYETVMRPGGLADLALRLKSEGKARAIGFSGHSVSTSRRAVESGIVEVLMFPLNLAGHAVPGRRDLLQACVDRSVGLVAMKPYAGGRLLRQGRKLEIEIWQRGTFEGVDGPPVEVERASEAGLTPTQCLAYILSLAGVSTVVPGCKDLEQLAAAQAIWKAPPAERDFAPVLADFAQYTPGECVYCNHCLPCPSTIDVGRVIRLLDSSHGKPAAEQTAAYAALDVPASECSECGACAERCPFGVDSVAKVRQAAAVFEALA